MDDDMINPGWFLDCAEEQASESSAAETPLFDESDDSEYRPTFQYMPLESSSNSIRLVVLKPDGGNHASNITCRITHTTFGAKPVYEALSYTWGDETLKKNIKLDGCLFAVSNNLYEAISHLRNPETERTFWIDAISINQTDTDEKSSQIRIMPFIYKRAETVVVWLGSGMDLKPNESEYWERLWVIQEFGMARRLIICWANKTHWTTYIFAWDGFQIVAGSSNTIKNDNVLKFKKLRETWYLGNRLLRNLLKDHQDAKCKDPRDKIYGLVGISTDCFRRLPMDYRKTLWEVYKDVVTIHRLDPEILGLSRLLRSLIGGPDKISPRDLEAKATEKLELDPADFTTVQISSSLLGMIGYLGPTYNDIISSFESVSDWEEAIEQELPHHKPESTREQSDLFLEALEVISEEVLNARLSLSQKIAWRHRAIEEERIILVFSDRKAKLDTSGRPRTSSRLFLIKDDVMPRPQTPMGVACKGAKVGDLVFQVPDYDLAMVVRNQGNQWILVGYAGMAMTAEQRKRTGRPQENSKGLFDIADSDTLTNFCVCLDMATLYKMSD